MNGLGDGFLSFGSGSLTPLHVPGCQLPVFVVSWLTVKVRVRVAMLHTDQTVGSSVTKVSRPVVTVSGVTWTSTGFFPFLRVWGRLVGWDRYRLGHPAVEVLATSA